jgi:transposase
MANGKSKTRNAKKHLREETKMEIVHDYYLGALNKTHLAEKYGVGWETVHKIIRKFAAENDKSALLMGKHTTDSLSEENKALRKEVMELKKKLYDETMRADFYDTMIDVAEEMFGIEIRKKADTGQSKGCTKTK